MKGTLPIVFRGKIGFEVQNFIGFLEDNGIQCKSEKDRYICKADPYGIVISIVKSSVTCQGQLTKEAREIISKLNTLDYLTLDQKNLKKYSEIFQSRNSMIICQECGGPTEVVEGKSDQSGNLEFRTRCNHVLQTNSPIFVSRTRLLPDLNTLISRTISRLIEKGFFNGFEIVLPEYYDKFVDKCFKSNGGKRKTFLEEKERLNELENQGKIKVYTYHNNEEIGQCEDESTIEDDKIFDFATITFSLLITGDKTLKEKSITKNLDCIFLTQSLNSAAKYLSKLDHVSV